VTEGTNTTSNYGIYDWASDEPELRRPDIVGATIGILMLLTAVLVGGSIGIGIGVGAAWWWQR
jgi:hypothetical protein